ncbi:MAG TPA: class I SAM-dependent methyltransferase [Nocardioidaceae bacterium]|nr:class I SAM-dependent methyltransferase [Nocardioidaceae bacterium]
MRDPVKWTPTKFVIDATGSLAPSTRSADLSVTSRLGAAFVADFYTSMLPAYASGLLLDLGCGNQPLFAAYKRYASTVVAMDWPQSAHASPHLDAYCDLTAQLPIADKVVDTVLLSDVLEHLPEPELLFSEVARVLRPGGRLILNTPFMYQIHEAPHDYLRHTTYSLRRHTEKCGLVLTELVELGGAGDVLLDVLCKITARVPVIGRVAARLIQDLAVRTRNTRFATGIRARTTSMPMGYGLVAVKPPVPPRGA